VLKNIAIVSLRAIERLSLEMVVCSSRAVRDLMMCLRLKFTAPVIKVATIVKKTRNQY
jgi:hypothetical protein